ncbi:unnamed protein product [Penicillium pancosmium]
MSGSNYHGKEVSKKGKEVEGLGIMNVEVPTQTKKPENMPKLCTCYHLCQHKKLARDEQNKGKKREERPDVHGVLRHAERKAKNGHI